MTEPSPFESPSDALSGTHMAARIGSLFSGYGGLELGVQAVLGGSTAWVSDIDPGACRILAHRYPHVPNLGDIERVGLDYTDAEWVEIKAAERLAAAAGEPYDMPRPDWSTVEPVDVLTGGFPCQDVSHAGARKGLGPATRSGLWSRMADAIDHLRPSLVIAENVRGLLSAEAASDVEPCPWCLGDGAGEPPLRALGAVLADLAELGYDASWYGLRAADVGAPHGRFRVFILARPRDLAPAESSGARAGRVAAVPGAVAEARRAGVDVRAVVDARGDVAADATSHGRDEGRPEPAGLIGGPDAAVGGDAPADTDGGERDRRECLTVGESLGRATAAGSGEGHHGGHAAPGADHGDDEQCPTCGDLVDWHDEGGFCAGLCGGTCTDPEWGRPGWVNGEPPADGDPEGGGVADQPVSGDPTGLNVGAVAGAVHRDRTGGPAEGVHVLGRTSSVVAWGPYEPAIRRWERVLGRAAPAPTEPGSKGQPRLSPAFVEWMMGLPAGWVTQVPGLSRNEQFKALGNGVVPQQAAAAIAFLIMHAGQSLDDKQLVLPIGRPPKSSAPKVVVNSDDYPDGDLLEGWAS